MVAVIMAKATLWYCMRPYNVQILGEAGVSGVHWTVVGPHRTCCIMLMKYLSLSIWLLRKHRF